MWDPPAARAVVPALRELFQRELGWSGPRWEAEEAAFADALEAWTLAGVRGAVGAADVPGTAEAT
jgi:hypothetical protein